MELSFQFRVSVNYIVICCVKLQLWKNCFPDILENRDVEVVNSSIASASTPIASLFHNRKTRKQSLTIFNFCESVACLLLHFIILRRQKPIHIMLLLYVLRSSLLLRTTLCFFFLDARTRVECITVLFNSFVISEVMYFRVCHKTPTNKSLEITSCL